MRREHHVVKVAQKPITPADEVGRLRRELYAAQHRIHELEAEVEHLKKMQTQSWWAKRKTQKT